ncbi:hypothetical protein GCM10009733_020270 [Nonomuraea maheshkhaliensis]|uniref:FCD domain-containing protein n=1 Tax=Nonomuraea maheshkhaliensis TaxID=419590 RepID=A0ABN2EZE6_9ACTN
MITTMVTHFGLVFVIPRHFAHRSSGFAHSIHLTRKVWNALIENDDLADERAHHVRCHDLLWETAHVAAQMGETSAASTPMSVVRERANAQLLEATVALWPSQSPHGPLTIAFAEESPATT